MRQSTLGILIPAAGASRRLGQPKQLVLYQGQSLIRRAVNIAESLRPTEVVVVTGAHAEMIEQEVNGTSAQCIRNPDWLSGMGSSIASGTKAMGQQTNGLMVLLCDQWRVQQTDLRSLLETWRTDTNRIVCSETRARRCPPVIFPHWCFAALRKLSGDQGAHDILDAHSDWLTVVQVDNAASDLDTPAQLGEINGD